MCWELTCDGLVSRPGGVKTLIRLTLWKLEISAGSVGHLVRKGFSFTYVGVILTVIIVATLPTGFVFSLLLMYFGNLSLFSYSFDMLMKPKEVGSGSPDGCWHLDIICLWWI